MAVSETNSIAAKVVRTALRPDAGEATAQTAQSRSKTSREEIQGSVGGDLQPASSLSAYPQAPLQRSVHTSPEQQVSAHLTQALFELTHLRSRWHLCRTLAHRGIMARRMIANTAETRRPGAVTFDLAGFTL